MEFSDDFVNAAQDYFDLLNKKYPQKTILELVGNRYKLSRTERSMLYRGVASESENKLRAEKLIDERLTKNKVLSIDGFNQLLTIASYLNGDKVFISTDGFMRDASEIHGKVFRSELLERSIDLIKVFLISMNLECTVIYIDKQLNDHDTIKDYILNASNSTKNDVVLSEQVDKELKSLSSGIIATSDSQIIEESKVKIFDLARYTLKFHFNPKITNLKTLLLK